MTLPLLPMQAPTDILSHKIQSFNIEFNIKNVHLIEAGFGVGLITAEAKLAVVVIPMRSKYVIFHKRVIFLEFVKSFCIVYLSKVI